MKMRMLQISCLLVLSFVARSAPVNASSLFEGDCVGVHCTDCNDPNPSGTSCFVGPGGGEQETCQFYGCRAIEACGEDLLYAQCECDPCPGK